MQTFLPYPDFRKSLECLDNRRLGKQRVETKQIFNAIHGLSKGWVNHPAVVMWRNYVPALIEYGILSCQIWMSRGHHDTLLPFFYENRQANVVFPNWPERFYKSHQSNLKRKDPIHYPFNVPDNLPYYWPGQ